MLLFGSFGRARGRLKESLVFKGHVAISHSSDVIANSPRPADLAGSFAGLPADGIWIFEIEAEKFLEHAHGAKVWFADFPVIIQIFVKVISQFEVHGPPFWAVSDQRAGLAARFIGGFNACASDIFFSGCNDIFDLAIDNAADDKIPAA